MIERLKTLAKEREVPYQSPFQIFRAERIEADLDGQMIASQARLSAMRFPPFGLRRGAGVPGVPR